VGVSLALDSLWADNLHLADASAWKPSPGFYASGQLGSPAGRNPRALAGTAVASSWIASHVCLLDPAGQAWCWGGGGQGQLGNGTVSLGTLPAPVVQAGLRFGSLAVGIWSTCFADAAGDLYCTGMLPVASEGSLVPTLRVSGTTGGPWGGKAICVRAAAGGPLCWGWFGQTPLFFAPPPLPPDGEVAETAAGESFACVRLADGTIRCRGDGGVGQLGNGAYTFHTDAYVPVVQPAGVTFTAVTAGWYHACALTSAGAAYCWGFNAFGEVGDGTGETRFAPTRVVQPEGVTFASIGAGFRHTCALSTEGRVYCWGFNDDGELGNGSRTRRLTPTPVRVPAGITFSALATHGTGGCALARPSGQPACWGYNGGGGLGDGTTTDRLAPFSVGP
jgi:alpha-tubulin suppressor-like RCC1 family protein